MITQIELNRKLEDVYSQINILKNFSILKNDEDDRKNMFKKKKLEEEEKRKTEEEAKISNDK